MQVGRLLGARVHRGPAASHLYGGRPPTDISFQTTFARCRTLPRRRRSSTRSRGRPSTRPSLRGRRPTRAQQQPTRPAAARRTATSSSSLRTSGTRARRRTSAARAALALNSSSSRRSRCSRATQACRVCFSAQQAGSSERLTARPRFPACPLGSAAACRPATPLAVRRRCFVATLHFVRRRLLRSFPAIASPPAPRLDGLLLDLLLSLPATAAAAAAAAAAARLEPNGVCNGRGWDE